jgi:Flp pilus assembly protein TadG
VTDAGRRRRAVISSVVGRRQFDERGSAELVVATPLLLLLILIVIQFALFEHASQVAQTAAAEALASTRTDGATTSAGQTEAQVILHAVGHGVLLNSAVSVTRSATVATVTVTGTTEAVLPFLHLPVHATSSGPVERFAAGP